MGELVRPIIAEIHSDARRSLRRTLKLTAHVEARADTNGALIHDISETGLRIETDAQLIPGEILLVELPFVGVIEARIIWQKDSGYGCEFIAPVSQGTVSAALLKSTPAIPGPRDETMILELPVGTRPTLEEMTTWEIEFERTRGAAGYQLIGFRQTSEGAIVAMVLKGH